MHHLPLMDFWGRRVLPRIVIITGFVFVTYNPWMGVVQYLSGDFKAAMCSDAFQASDHLVTLLASLIFLGLWFYLLNRCWRGVGQSFLKAAIPAAIILLILYILIDKNIVTYGSTALVLCLELAIGLILGLCFTFTLIDRQLSGIVTTSTIIETDTHHQV